MLTILNSPYLEDLGLDMTWQLINLLNHQVSNKTVLQWRCYNPFRTQQKLYPTVQDSMKTLTLTVFPLSQVTVVVSRIFRRPAVGNSLVLTYPTFRTSVSKLVLLSPSTVTSVRSELVKSSMPGCSNSIAGTWEVTGEIWRFRVWFVSYLQTFFALMQTAQHFWFFGFSY